MAIMARNATSFAKRAPDLVLSDAEAIGYAQIQGFTPKDCELAHHDGEPSSIQRSLVARWGIGEITGEIVG